MSLNSSTKINRNLTMIVKIIARSLGIPSFLNDCTTSCIGEVDERITIAVKQTSNLANKRTVQFKPVSVINNHV